MKLKPLRKHDCVCSSEGKLLKSEPKSQIIVKLAACAAGTQFSGWCAPVLKGGAKNVLGLGWDSLLL